MLGCSRVDLQVIRPIADPLSITSLAREAQAMKLGRLADSVLDARRKPIWQATGRKLRLVFARNTNIAGAGGRAGGLFSFQLIELS